MRGPCTPSTRSSSMSDVALGPETNVSGRPSARGAGASAAIASGTRRGRRPASTTQTCRSGTSVSARRPLRGAAVEHDRAGLGDRQRAAGEHAVERVEVARRERRVVDDAARRPARRAARRAATATAARRARAHAAATASASSPRGDAPHGRAVLGGALAEPRDDVRVAGGRAGARRRGRRAARPARRRPRRAPRTPDPRALSACDRPRAPIGAAPRSSAARHQSRNDCSGTVGQLAHRRPAGQPRVAAAARGRACASRCARS